MNNCEIDIDKWTWVEDTITEICDPIRMMYWKQHPVYKWGQRKIGKLPHGDRVDKNNEN